MSSWQADSPTRVDLGGGTLDCWPLFLLTGDCVTVNLSISIYTRAKLQVRSDRRISIFLRDLGLKKEFRDLEHLLSDQDPMLRMIQVHASYWQPKQGFTLETFSESPVGGGLGGSSSLSISLIKVFSQWMGKSLSVDQSVILSGNLEAQVLGKMTGTQDYFPPLSPGLNAIHYTPAGPKLENLKTSPDLWNQCLTLVYTGQPHHSGLNNWQVLKAALDGDRKTMDCLQEIRKIGWDVYECVKSEAWSDLPKLFDREFDARVRLASAFSSPEIERLRAVSLNSGAQAVKICGAGGGGCVLVWSTPQAKQKVEQGCRDQGFEVLSAKAVLP